MVTSAHHIGDLRRIAGQWTVADVDTDPTTITFVMREPDGLETTYVHGTDAELVKDSVGNYHVDWPVAKEGRHFYTWIGTGTAAEAGQGEFEALNRKAG
jgi:hypothetical protein